MKHWQVRQKRNCKIKGAARQENIVDYYCMNYLFKSSHKVAQSYILFMLTIKNTFVSYLLAYVYLVVYLFVYSCTCRKKNLHPRWVSVKAKNWLDHLLLMTSNLVTMETDLHILSYSKKTQKPIRKGVGNHHGPPRTSKG